MKVSKLRSSVLSLTLATSVVAVGCSSSSDNAEVLAESPDPAAAAEQLRQELLTEDGSRILHMNSIEVDVGYAELLRGSEAIVIAEVGEPFVRKPDSDLFDQASSTDTTIVMQTATVTEVLRSPEGSLLAPGREVALVVGVVNPENELLRSGRVVLPYGSTGVIPTGSHALLMNRLTPGVASAFLEDESEIGYRLAASYHPATFLQVSGDSVSVSEELVILPPTDRGSKPLDDAAVKNIEALNPERTFKAPGSLDELRNLVQEAPFDPDYDIPAEG